MEKVIGSYTFHTKHVWTHLFTLMIIALFIAVFGVFNAACLKLFMDIASGESQVPISIGILLSLAVISLQRFFMALKNIFKTKTTNKIAQTAKIQLLTHMEKVRLQQLYKYHSGDLLTRISDDADLCAEVLPGTCISIFVGAASFIISLVYAFMLSWKLTLLCVLLSPLAVIYSKLVLPFLQKYAALTRKKEGEIRAFTQEEISYIPIIKSFSSYHQSEKRFNTEFEELSHARIMRSIANAVLEGGSAVVGFFSFIGATSFGAYLTLKGEITVGTIVGFIQLLNYIVWPFSEMMPLIGNFQTAKAARARLREIEEIPCEEEEKQVELLGGNIMLQIQNLSFSFGEGDLIRNVNMKLEGKQFVGVMGPSGSGKSTFVRLLLALYEPTRGQIYLTDGSNKVSGTSIRKYISYVPQDHLLISGTIAENIAFGQDSFEMDAVISAAERAGISEFISSLPQQYQTQVQEKGTNLSYGQAQRIAIARAIYKDAPVLILDEPTASLDMASRQHIMETLKAESEKRLCIMVCHDQAENSEFFDKVLTVEHGDITIMYNAQ